VRYSIVIYERTNISTHHCQYEQPKSDLVEVRFSKEQRKQSNRHLRYTEAGIISISTCTLSTIMSTAHQDFVVADFLANIANTLIFSAAHCIARCESCNVKEKVAENLFSLHS
jgi:hypothetical protein